MSLHDFLDLCLIFGLHCLDNGVRIILGFFLVVVAPLLKLLECHFKLALRFKQVSLVIVFLCLKEHCFAFP